MKQRIKHCVICKVDFPTMYRVQYKNPKEWVFVCKKCLIDVKKDNPNYTCMEVLGNDNNVII